MICIISSILAPIIPVLPSDQRPLPSPMVSPSVALSIVPPRPRSFVVSSYSIPNLLCHHHHNPPLAHYHLSSRAVSHPISRIRPFLLFTVGSLTSHHPAPLIKLYIIILVYPIPHLVRSDRINGELLTKVRQLILGPHSPIRPRMNAVHHPRGF
jgi:hypothetical protein